MAGKRNGGGGAVEFLHNRYIGDDPAKLAALERERVHAFVAQLIYDLRTKAKLSQRELAKKVGTSASVICQLENADYQGHSLAMLTRIAAAMNRGVNISFPLLKQTKRVSPRRGGSRPPKKSRTRKKNAPQPT